MQNYQLFWNQDIAPGGYRQLVIDWDTFIENFTKVINMHAHYQLNSLQKTFIKSKIDPSGTNQIYKNAFLLFAQNYWDLPSNRTNLFKMKMNISSLPKFALLTSEDPEKILILLNYSSIDGQQKQLKYLLKENILHQVDDKGFEHSEKPLKEPSFLSIGSHEANDIPIDDCYFLNQRHFKLICVKKEKKVTKRMLFSEKSEESTIESQWFIRDVAKSNRLRYLLDNPWKYVAVKPGMVLNIGITDDFQIRIDKVGFNTNSFILPAVECQQISNTLNADRLNFMGQIDPNIPLKTIIDIDFYQITPKQIESLQEQGQYYPEFLEDNAPKAQKTGKQESPTVSFTLINKRTFKKREFVSKNSCFMVGRSEECAFRVDEAWVRKKEVIFQLINNRWTVRGAENHSKLSLDCNIPSVWITSAGNLTSQRNSNRLKLKQGYPFVLRGKKIDFSVQLIKPIKEQQP